MKRFLKQSMSGMFAGLFLLSNQSDLINRSVFAVETAVSEPKCMEKYEFKGDDGRSYILDENGIRNGNECVVYKCKCKEDGRNYVLKVLIGKVNAASGDINVILEDVRRDCKLRSECTKIDWSDYRPKVLNKVPQTPFRKGNIFPSPCKQCSSPLGLFSPYRVTGKVPQSPHKRFRVFGPEQVPETPMKNVPVLREDWFNMEENDSDMGVEDLFAVDWKEDVIEQEKLSSTKKRKVEMPMASSASSSDDNSKDEVKHSPVFSGEDSESTNRNDSDKDLSSADSDTPMDNSIEVLKTPIKENSDEQGKLDDMKSILRKDWFNIEESDSEESDSDKDADDLFAGDLQVGVIEPEKLFSTKKRKVEMPTVGNVSSSDNGSKDLSSADFDIPRDNSISVGDFTDKGDKSRVESSVSGKSKKVSPLDFERQGLVRPLFVERSVLCSSEANDKLARYNIPHLVEVVSFHPHIEREYGPNLAEVISSGTYEENHVKIWVRDLLDALIALNSLGLCHRDVKPANIFLDGTGHVVLGDLGTVCERDRCICTDSRVGTAGYMAPEVWKKSQFNIALCDRADIFSLGITVLELLTDFRAAPDGSELAAKYAERNERTIISDIMADRYHMSDGRCLSQAWKNFLISCLQPNSSGRLTAESARALFDTSF